MGSRKLSPEEVAALGLDAPETPAQPRKLSPEEVKALGLDAPADAPVPHSDGPSPNLTPWQALGEDLLGKGADVSPNDSPAGALGKDLMVQFKSGVNGLTLGALPYGVAAADSALHDVPFDEALRDAKHEGNDVEKRAPASALLGSLLTPIPGAGEARGALKVAKMAASGAGAAGLNSYLHNENPDRAGAVVEAIPAAALGAI